MPAVRLSPIVRAVWKAHRFVLRVTRGRLGSRLGNMPVMLLRTTGRSSGLPRSVGLSHVARGGRYYVVGSYAGQDRDPAWALNLRATPRAEITVGGRTTEVVARELEGADREAMFERFVRMDPAYGEYRGRTTRVIPVFELSPDGP
jgi:deazaflavin-dependent oxidoreductase (nitroreductase family)